MIFIYTCTYMTCIFMYVCVTRVYIHVPVPVHSCTGHSCEGTCRDEAIASGRQIFGGGYRST